MENTQERASIAASAAIFGLAGPRLEAEERAFFADADPWGFILFARNLETAAQIRALTSELRAVVGRDAPILIDQEGGRVARLRPPLAHGWSPVGAWCDKRDVENGWSEDALLEALRLRGRLIAGDLRTLGIDVDCAPVLDLNLDGADPIIGDRALGATPARVGPRARAVLDGLLEGGALGVVKHLPGHGRAGVDSHVAAPVVAADLATLDEDFRAFDALADAPLGMTAHVVYAAIDEARVGTCSASVVRGVIRERIGFSGALMSDDLTMGALEGSLAQRAADALSAGCDLALHCNGAFQEMAEVMTETPRLEGAPLERVRRAEAARPAPQPVDVEAAMARLLELGAPGVAPEEAAQ